MSKTMKKIGFFLCACSILVACSNDEEATKAMNVNLNHEDLVVDHESFSIPSPNEQLDLLYMLGGEMKSGIVHDLGKIDTYVDAQQMAFVFGIYSADAAYQMRFDQGRKIFLDYVSALDRLGERMGIAQLYGKDLLEIIESSSSNQELYAISNDNYLKVYGRMIENGREDDLALILAGGWIEIMHILFEANGKFGSNPELESSMTEQLYVLDNLMAFMEQHNRNGLISELIDKLHEIHRIFGDLDCSTAELKVEEGEIVHIAGGETCLFTESSYIAMRQAIASLRNSKLNATI
jgi:hypothetical protein